MDIREQMVKVLSTIQVMSSQVVAYARSEDDARKNASNVLHEARTFAGMVDAGKKSQAEYYNKFLRRPGDPESPVPRQESPTQSK